MQQLNRIIMVEKTTGFINDAAVLSNTILNTRNYINDKDMKTNRMDKKQAFLNIYIQNIKYGGRRYLNRARYNILKINHELFMRTQTPANIRTIHQIDIVLCKTKIGVEIAKKFRKKYRFKYKIVYIKFTSNTTGLVPSNKKDWSVILHAAGQHHWKQTDLVLKLWTKHPELPKVIITCAGQCLDNIKERVPEFFKKKYDNIELHQKLLPRKKINEHLNNIGIHLCPSLSEGYGHYINEARYLKALIITSDHQPMNELVTKKSGILIKCGELVKKKNGTDICVLKEEDLLKGINKALKMPLSQKKKLGNKANSDFKRDTKYFEAQMKKLLKILYTSKNPFSNPIFL